MLMETGMRQAYIFSVSLHFIGRTLNLDRCFLKNALLAILSRPCPDQLSEFCLIMLGDCLVSMTQEYKTNQNLDLKGLV